MSPIDYAADIWYASSSVKVSFDSLASLWTRTFNKQCLQLADFFYKNIEEFAESRLAKAKLLLLINLESSKGK